MTWFFSIRKSRTSKRRSSIINYFRFHSVRSVSVEVKGHRQQQVRNRFGKERTELVWRRRTGCLKAVIDTTVIRYEWCNGNTRTVRRRDCGALTSNYGWRSGTDIDVTLKTTWKVQKSVWSTSKSLHCEGKLNELSVVTNRLNKETAASYIKQTIINDVTTSRFHP